VFEFEFRTKGKQQRNAVAVCAVCIKLCDSFWQQKTPGQVTIESQRSRFINGKSLDFIFKV